MPLPTKKESRSEGPRETFQAKQSISRSRMSKIDIGDAGGGKILLKPEDQLQLTEAELQEEIARVLLIQNTRIPDALVEWSWRLGEFIRLPLPPNLISILDIPGTILHRDSDEAKVLMAGGFLEAQVTDRETKPRHEDEEEGEEGYEGEKLDYGEYEGEQEIGPEPGDEFETMSKEKKLPNQFNFCERAALTYGNPIRDATTQTVPPPTAVFNTHVLQWIIFDEYQEDFAQQQREREKERRTPFAQAKKEDFKKKVQMEAAALTQRMVQAAKTLERMVNQNIFDETSRDYRYWDDPSDEFKDGEGSLLPLWKFSYEKAKKYDVTDMCFNDRYYDLFAVSFGTMSFNKPLSDGIICLFSLKNPSYPEWICTTNSPVMCLDFNNRHPHLLVIGLMDGSVAIYNTMLPTTVPQYKSNDVTQKHGGLVWEVRWAFDTEEGNLAFYSVSIDGKINHWVLNQNDLGLTTIMTLFLNRPPIPGPDGTILTLKGCGTCIAFHPSNSNTFLVGTEEGTIYKCNTAYSSIYMKTYNEAHDMPVYRIVFNKYDTKIFATCSGDWRIKIWEDDRLEPLFMFDLGVPIGDVQWAPYSSTVLACVTNDGKVAVFDLNVNKYRPICSQPIVSRKKNKLTRLAFNNELPFIIVGDDKGTVNTLKLSPNLRLKVKRTKKELHMSETELELIKLEKLLSFIREPPELTPPKDTED